MEASLSLLFFIWHEEYKSMGLLALKSKNTCCNLIARTGQCCV